MRREEVCFEEFAQSQGYNTQKHPLGGYVDNSTTILRRGFATGFSAGIKTALQHIRELIEKNES